MKSSSPCGAGGHGHVVHDSLWPCWLGWLKQHRQAPHGMAAYAGMASRSRSYQRLAGNPRRFFTQIPRTETIFRKTHRPLRLWSDNFLSFPKPAKTWEKEIVLGGVSVTPFLSVWMHLWYLSSWNLPVSHRGCELFFKWARWLISSF